VVCTNHPYIVDRICDRRERDSFGLQLVPPFGVVTYFILLRRSAPYMNIERPECSAMRSSKNRKSSRNACEDDDSHSSCHDGLVCTSVDHAYSRDTITARLGSLLSMVVNICLPGFRILEILPLRLRIQAGHVSSSKSTYIRGSGPVYRELGSVDVMYHNLVFGQSTYR
jgi:hypothetical protein